MLTRRRVTDKCSASSSSSTIMLSNDAWKRHDASADSSTKRPSEDEEITVIVPLAFQHPHQRQRQGSMRINALLLNPVMFPFCVRVLYVIASLRRTAEWCFRVRCLHANAITSVHSSGLQFHVNVCFLTQGSTRHSTFCGRIKFWIEFTNNVMVRQAAYRPALLIAVLYTRAEEARVYSATRAQRSRDRNAAGDDVFHHQSPCRRRSNNLQLTIRTRQLQQQQHQPPQPKTPGEILTANVARRRVTPLKFNRKTNKNSLPRDFEFESRSVDGRRVSRRAVSIVFPRRTSLTVATCGASNPRTRLSIVITSSPLSCCCCCKDPSGDDFKWCTVANRLLVDVRARMLHAHSRSESQQMSGTCEFWDTVIVLKMTSRWNWWHCNYVISGITKHW